VAGSLELQQVRERLRYDTPFWGRHCATILDVNKRPVRLVARPWQARTPETPAHVTPLDEALEAQRAAGQPQRAIILKARKLGFSTWVQAKSVQRVTQRPFQYALTVAHRRDAARVLFDMAKLMYKRLPTEEELGLGFSIRPHWLGGTDVARQTGGYMTLGDRARPEEASTYETQTAGAKGGGRASTPSVIHGSEVAHWEDPDYLTGLFNALPMLPDTVGVLESTAAGFNHFFDLWQRAVEGAEDPETGVLWAPLFYGWQDNPFNALPFISEQARERFERTIGDPAGGGDDEETWLVEQFGVTLEQLNWRRAVIAGPECKGRLEIFHQEHPATAEQAFIGSGHPVFSGLLVSRAIKAAEAEPEPVSGLLRGEEWVEKRTRAGTILVPQRAVWVPDADVNEQDRDLWGFRERLLVWEHPVNAATEEGKPLLERKPDGQYVAFVDVAAGKDATLEERDYSVIQVIDHLSRMQVARYRSRIPIHDLPLAALLVALYYNGAVLAPEVTGLGIGVVDALAKDYRYPLYRRHRSGDDRRADSREQLLGWQTDTRTKPLMEVTFGSALKEGVHGLRDVPTARQFTTYVEDEKGNHGAQRGTFDDLVMAYMGAQRVASEMVPRDPKRKKVRGRAYRPNDPLLGY
jgi:hypothetical protein